MPVPSVLYSADQYGNVPDELRPNAEISTVQYEYSYGSFITSIRITELHFSIFGSDYFVFGVDR